MATASPQPEMRHGDLAFWSINVPDVATATRFYSALFDWSYSAPGPSGAVRIDGHQAAMHPSGHKDPSAIWICASDIHEVVDGIRGAGGQASDVLETPQGHTATIVDPWGVRAALSYREDGWEPLLPVEGHGELDDWVLESRDPERSAQLLTEIFGWQLRAEDGGYRIGSTLVPGLIRPAAEPGPATFRFGVADPRAAERTVRRHGGQTETGPGGTVRATDDQAYPFSLRPV